MDIQDQTPDIPRRQPDGDPPVPPVEIPDPGASAEGGAAAAGAIVTTDDLRDLLEAPGDATLVVEGGEARVVDDPAAADGLPVLDQEALTTMLDGPGADASDETLSKVAAGLDGAVREQGV
jgi:hypothetical protein